MPYRPRAHPSTSSSTFKTSIHRFRDEGLLFLQTVAFQEVAVIRDSYCCTSLAGPNTSADKDFSLDFMAIERENQTATFTHLKFTSPTFHCRKSLPGKVALSFSRSSFFTQIFKSSLKICLTFHETLASTDL